MSKKFKDSLVFAHFFTVEPWKEFNTNVRMKTVAERTFLFPYFVIVSLILFSIK